MAKNTIPYDIVYVGNYTRDKIITPTETRYVDGGAVNYAAHAAVRLGFRTAVVTRLASEDIRMIAALELAGVDCYPVYTPASTCITLEYKSSNVDQRNLSVTSTAGTIDPQQMEALKTRSIVVGSSLRGEVELDFFRVMRQRKDIKVGVDVQGFVRVLRGQTLVYEPWGQMAEILAKVDILKSDAVEAEFLTGERDIEKAARFYANLGPGEIVLTHSTGVLIHADGRDYHFDFFPGDVSGRSGRGDTCLGAYAAMRLSHTPEESGKWAAAVTSMKLQKPGPFDRSLSETKDFLQSHFPA